MKTIGLTGGIGSGKSSLLSVFEANNIPVFKADDIAKKLLDTTLRSDIESHFGSGLYVGNRLDRKALAALVFTDKKRLNHLNALVHPAVAKAFDAFKAAHQEAPLVVKEAAILFESGGAQSCDYTILITAPKKERIKRVMQRDQLSEAAILARMAQQWTDEKKIPLADFVIQNENLSIAKEQLKAILTKLKRA